MLSLIVAMTKNNVIGKNNTIPWHITEDYVRTHKKTRGHPIIMGRKNYETISSFVNFKGSSGEKAKEDRVLPNRTNIIITRQKDYKVNGGVVVHSLEEAIEEAKKAPGSEEAFIFGGAGIYKESLEKDLVDKMYITLIDEEIDGDTFFPEIDKDKWELKKELKRVTRVNEKEIVYYFQTFVKNS